MEMVTGGVGIGEGVTGGVGIGEGDKRMEYSEERGSSVTGKKFTSSSISNLSFGTRGLHFGFCSRNSCEKNTCEG